jgi:type I restriction enzyme, R subunit
MAKRKGQPDLFPLPKGTSLKGFSEDALVEGPSHELFEKLGWGTANLLYETLGSDGTEGRTSERDAFLPRRLQEALRRLNPDLPAEAIEQAYEELTRDRSTMLPIAANRELYALLKEGCPVKVRKSDGEQITERARFIDWRTPENNDFFCASQMWFRGELYRRRCDLVGFVNGIPLVFLELKAAHRSVRDAYDKNLADYLVAIPQIFVPNAFVILSNGPETEVGAALSSWDHFFEWKRLEDEDDEAVVSLETTIRALCARDRLLDYVENFIAFQEERGGLAKKPAKNHQYLGVNRAIQAVRNLKENRGRLGVFWHTQGSGKSLSMVYFAQKVLRTLPGDWTFVVVTDRQELDEQIAKTFASVGALGKEIEQVQAQSRDHLKTLLTGNERYVFTLIQKFGTTRGEQFPKLSDRSDVIVMTDEAHRSQYDILAANMRRALPKAAFIGFTGTPLMAGEERTREVFGDYVSIYDFSQSITDGATVPLYYENRIPELQLSRADLREALEEVLEAAELDEEQEKRLQREFARAYHLITRDDRLERIAQDVTRHFFGRGYRGKAMFICIDKATAVRMYDKVQRYWKEYIGELEAKVAGAPAEERAALQENLDWVRGTDMAVVVSQGQNELAEMKAKGLDIVPHRKRMVAEDMDEKFKNPDDRFRLVFVCAMWITGFDVPSCSTVYLDKPMKNHTLMQTIARANRVAPGKQAGIIVDYVGVFRDLQKALAIYAQRGGAKGQPIEDKAALVELLERALEAATEFCEEREVSCDAILEVEGFERAKRIRDAVEALTGTDPEKQRFLALAGDVWKVYKAVLPDPRAVPYAGRAVVLQVLAERVRSLTPKPDISVVMARVEEVLDSAVTGVHISAPLRTDGELDQLFDLSRIDFEKLRNALKGNRSRSKAAALRIGVERKLRAMVRVNPLRQQLMEKFETLIAEYNAGTKSAEQLLKDLLEFVKTLGEEDRRASREKLSEEELAIFDLLTKPDPTLTKPQEVAVKKVARALLDKLRREKFILDWTRKEQARADVRKTIAEDLDMLPEPYTKEIYDRKCDSLYQFFYERYYGEPEKPGGTVR